MASQTLITTSTGAVVVSSVARSTSNWRQRYTRILWATDLLVLMGVVFGTQVAWFGLGNAELAIREDGRLSPLSYWVFSAALVIAWMWSLSLIDSRSDRVIGSGWREYGTVASASLRLFGVIAIGAFLTHVEVARGFLLISLPVGVAVLLFERSLWRWWLLAQRSRGDYSAKVLLVGSRSSVYQIARELQRNPRSGYHVVGACVPSGSAAETIAGTNIPVMGTVDQVDRAMAAAGADTVAITSTDALPPDKVKQISWGLEAGKQHLVLAPSIVDIAGPRLSTRPVAGLPLIHVETPRFTGGQRLVKRTTDIAVSLVGIIVLSPVFAFLAMAIRLSSDGPILFAQERVGYHGTTFRMLKFRSMVVNAEELLDDIRDSRNMGNEVLFKMKDDPRVTPIGRIMRRFSLDELPQLFNVLSGSMSLVGPRPSLRSEVDQYADHVHRRFLVKPGVTGLWQVSGRSSLSWEESVRLDLSYVENWTLFADFLILCKTARAALAPGETVS